MSRARVDVSGGQPMTEPMEAQDRGALLTADDVAAHLSVSVSTVRAWRLRGAGPPAVKLGGRVRWRMTDVEQWVRAHREDTTGPTIQAGGVAGGQQEYTGQS